MHFISPILMTLTVLFVAGCSNPSIIDCAEVMKSPFERGTCEGEGIVVRPKNGTSEHLILTDGSYAVVELSLFPHLKDGDRVAIKAEYYRGEKHVDLANHDFIRKLD